MSDIPIGSPPAPPGRHAAPGGWYLDPVDPGQERYWDGWQWSRNTRPREQPVGSPPAPPRVNPAPPQVNPAPPYAQPYGGGYQYPTPPGQYGQPTAGYPTPAPMVGRSVARTADGVPLAGWWWRVLAAVIDLLIVNIVASIPSIGIYINVGNKFMDLMRETLRAQQSGAAPPALPFGTTFMTPQEQLSITIITVVVGLLYHVVFLRLKAATPGKLVTGLRVVPVDQGQNSGPLGWNVVVPRAAIWVIPGSYGLLFLFSLLDSLFPIWQPKRQALHDLAVKTQVVKLG